MKKLALTVAAGLFALGLTGPVSAAEGVSLPEENWSFDGVFGTIDRAGAQRGLQVYLEVCSACHGLRHVAFRTLSDLGYNEDEVKAIAERFEVEDGPDDNGDMFTRPARPSDHFPSPFANEQAARAANGGALPPDLTLMAEKRAGGADYIHALLTGYEEAPADFKVMPGLYYNKYFAGHQIAMAEPLFEGAVDYADGTEATVDQMAHDLSTFLVWAAEPMLDTRKQMGMKVILFLLVFTAVLYATKRRIWAKLH
jgi:ubiquinol-cytochrome c reductase cytochrome c1 subunit